MLLTSTQWVMTFALVSALSRAGLNIIDRYQIGQKKLSILGVNLWNNALPAVLMVLVALSFGHGSELLSYFFDWKTVLFGGLVQLVAYAFSYAFRHLHVNLVTVMGKFSDLLIPVGVFLTTRYWSWDTYGFAVATTLACLPILWMTRTLGSFRSIGVAGFAVSGALLLQASFSPLLAPAVPISDVRHLLIFATAVILWRTVWRSLAPLLHRRTGRRTPWLVPPFSPIPILRGLLTIVTQTAFIFAISSSASALAWPILNSTGFLPCCFRPACGGRKVAGRRNGRLPPLPAWRSFAL